MPNSEKSIGLQDQITLLEGKVESYRKSIETLTEALERQKKTRVEQFTIAQSFLTLGLVVAFGYQIAKTVETNDRLTKIDDNLRESRRTYDLTKAELSSYQRQRENQTIVVSKLVSGIVNIGSGYRDFSRERYGFAIDRAAKTIDELISYERLLDVYNSKASDSSMDETERDLYVSIKPLFPAIQQTLVGAYGLRARSYYQLADSSFPEAYQRIREDALKIQRVDQASWEGYHFLGIVELDNAVAKIGDSGARSPIAVPREIDLGIAHLDQSISLDPVSASIDHLNKAETALQLGRFQDAIDDLDRFTSARGKLLARVHSRVVKLYRHMAQSCLRDNIDELTAADTYLRKEVVGTEKNSEALRQLFKGFSLDSMKKFAASLRNGALPPVGIHIKQDVRNKLAELIDNIVLVSQGKPPK